MQAESVNVHRYSNQLAMESIGLQLKVLTGSKLKIFQSWLTSHQQRSYPRRRTSLRTDSPPWSPRCGRLMLYLLMIYAFWSGEPEEVILHQDHQSSLAGDVRPQVW